MSPKKPRTALTSAKNSSVAPPICLRLLFGLRRFRRTGDVSVVEMNELLHVLVAPTKSARRPGAELAAQVNEERHRAAVDARDARHVEVDRLPRLRPSRDAGEVVAQSAAASENLRCPWRRSSRRCARQVHKLDRRSLESFVGSRNSPSTGVRGDETNGTDHSTRRSRREPEQRAGGGHCWRRSHVVPGTVAGSVAVLGP